MSEKNNKLKLGDVVLIKQYEGKKDNDLHTITNILLNSFGDIHEMYELDHEPGIYYYSSDLIFVDDHSRFNDVMNTFVSNTTLESNVPQTDSTEQSSNKRMADSAVEMDSDCVHRFVNLISGRTVKIIPDPILIIDEKTGSCTFKSKKEFFRKDIEDYDLIENEKDKKEYGFMVFKDNKEKLISVDDEKDEDVYVIGEEYEDINRHKYCYCKSIDDCYYTYGFDKNYRICCVKIIGDKIKDENWFYMQTNHILILKEIEDPWKRTTYDFDEKVAQMQPDYGIEIKESKRS